MNKLNCVMKACGFFLLWAATAVALPAQTFLRLHSFDGSDGFDPSGAVVQATDGDLYGTTHNGGANGYYTGTIYKITPTGVLITLHNFDGTDGQAPAAGLIQGIDGNLYGTTTEGGSGCPEVGCGTVFKITLGGTLTTLHEFDATDGEGPNGALLQAADGNFYGTTSSGGAYICDGSGCGTIFKIAPDGTLTTLYNFCSRGGINCTDGRNPNGALVQGTDGNLYGTTYAGGSMGGFGYGTIFKTTLNGTLTTLYSFDYTTGTGPSADLAQGADGNFYGTAARGGTIGNGTVFKITSQGMLTTLYNFDGTDGDLPTGLVRATDGNFYGTTAAGGGRACSFIDGCGTVFEISASGAFRTLYIFHRSHSPPAPPIQDTRGDFYGTTVGGGSYGDGTIFGLSIGLSPFVKTNPASGTIGAVVYILGTNLVGATSVTFNGTVATFTVVSASEITTTVPTGATTGTVQVVTPGGTLSSNVPFTVAP